jgi:hypothetical protein
MAIENSFAQQLLDLLATRNFHPEMLDRAGRPTDSASDAKTLTFDYVSGAGKNYGTMVIILDIDNDMKVMYGDNLGRTMEGDDKQEFFDFIQQLNRKAVTNRWTHTATDISQLKHVMQGLAAIQEGLFEGYYGTRKISYSGQPTEARLQIVHNRVLDENDARHRYIDRMYIETADGERFRLGFKSLAGGKAMLEHVKQGGKPYDVRGCHITEMVTEIAVLSRFNRASAQRILEGVTQELVSGAQQYYHSLKENLRSLGHGRGYQRYFESWHPATITEQDEVISNIKTLFIEQTIDSRIEAALPLLAKIQQQGERMKEAEIFENWANTLVEGTWALPETPEQLDKLKTLMTKELIVGPDAVNATEQLYDIVGDDILFDRLSELAARDPRANAWNDTEVMDRLRELGIETPEQAPAGVQQPMAPTPGETPPAPAATPPATPVAGAEAPVREGRGTCNMTMEGEYCPEHGLSECAMESQEMAEAARWRDPKYKDRLYTQEPGDSDDYDNIGYGYDFPERPKNDPGQKRRIGGVGSEFDRNDPLVKGQGIGRSGIKHSLNLVGKRKGLPSRDQITSLKGSIKDAHGKHVQPNLPEQDMAEDSTDPMDHRGAVTDSFYESEIARMKKLALGR